MYVLSMPAAVKGRVVSPAGAAEPDAHAAEATAGTSAADAMVLDDDVVDVAVAAIVDVAGVATAVDGGDARVGVVVSTTASDGRATEVVGTEAPLLEHAPTAQATTASTTIR